MIVECVCKKKFEAHIAELRDGELQTVYYKMRGNHGMVVGVRLKNKDLCGKCHEEIKDGVRWGEMMKKVHEKEDKHGE